MITIVTDSSSYFKQAEAYELGIKIIPHSYTVDGKLYFESYSDQNGEYGELLKNKYELSTSQPNSSSFLSCFEEELANGNDVLCITISSRLSGTYSTAHMAAKQMESENIVVFDSHLTAGGLYLMIKRAKTLIDGGLSLNEIVENLYAIRDKIIVAFSVDDMTPLRKSGRIGFIRMSVGTILNKKPILLLNEGAIISNGIASGDIDIIKKLTNRLNKDTKELVINYIGSSRLATNIYGVIQSEYPGVIISLHKIGPVLGIHLGLNSVSVSFVETVSENGS